MLDVVHDFHDQFRRVHPPFWTDTWKKGDAANEPGLCPKSVEWTGLPVPRDAKYRLDSPREEFATFTKQGGEPPVFAHWQAWFEDRLPTEEQQRTPVLPIGPLKKLLDPDVASHDLYFQQIMDERMQCLSYIGTGSL